MSENTYETEENKYMHVHSSSKSFNDVFHLDLSTTPSSTPDVTTPTSNRNVVADCSNSLPFTGWYGGDAVPVRHCE